MSYLFFKKSVTIVIYYYSQRIQQISKVLFKPLSLKRCQFIAYLTCSFHNQKSKGFGTFDNKMATNEGRLAVLTGSSAEA